MEKKLLCRDQQVFIEFKKIRNLIKRNIRKIKEAHTLRLAKKIKDNPKAFWQHVNKLRKNRVGIESLVKMDQNRNEVILVNDVEKANHLAEFFQSVYVNSNDDNVYMNFFDSRKINENIIIEKIYVVNKLSLLNANKSAGPDDIFSKVLLECNKSISLFLCKFFNKSIKYNIIPDGWRHSIITPVYEKGDCNIVSNYRPISLNCICCKILESLIKDYLLKYFYDNKLLDGRQYGFTKGKSNTIQLLKLLDYLSMGTHSNGQEGSNESLNNSKYY